MTPAEAHQAAQAQTENAGRVLDQWVESARSSLTQDTKLDATARARLGELILNACRYLSEREDDLRKIAREAELKAERAAHDRRQPLPQTRGES